MLNPESETDPFGHAAFMAECSPLGRPQLAHILNVFISDSPSVSSSSFEPDGRQRRLQHQVSFPS